MLGALMTQHEIDDDGNNDLHACDTESLTAAGKELHLRHEHQTRGCQKRNAHSNLNGPLRPTSDHAGSEPCPENRCANHGKQRWNINRDDAGIDEGLNDGGQRVSDVERTGDDAVIDNVKEPEQRCCRCVGPDA